MRPGRIILQRRAITLTLLRPDLLPLLRPDRIMMQLCAITLTAPHPVLLRLPCQVLVSSRQGRITLQRRAITLTAARLDNLPPP